MMVNDDADDDDGNHDYELCFLFFQYLMTPGILAYATIWWPQVTAAEANPATTLLVSMLDRSRL